MVWDIMNKKALGLFENAVIFVILITFGVLTAAEIVETILYEWI